MYRKLLVPLLLCLLLLLVISGCQDSWVTPADTSAGNLDVKAVVLDFSPSSDGKNIVVMQFTFNGKPVRFAGGETMSCNGVALKLNELLFGYAERVPIQPVGGTYTFAYTQGGNTTSFNVTAPPRPVFVSPTAGSTVTRSTNLTIQYQPGGGAGVDATGSSPSGSVRRNIFQPDNGTYSGWDVSGFGAGAGTLGLIRRFEATIPGTAFRSAKMQYEVDSDINVIWN